MVDFQERSNGTNTQGGSLRKHFNTQRTMAYLRALLRDTRALATAAVAAGSLVPVVLSREKRQAFAHCQVMVLGCPLLGGRRHGCAARGHVPCCGRMR